MGELRDLPVLVLDCQAAGATPAYGDLLELGWAVCAGEGVSDVRSHWIVPRTERPVPRAVRELTGWTRACIAEAIEEQAAWEALCADATRVAAAVGPAPTVIHFARFELAFLRDLHARLDASAAFPFDALCVHAIAARLFPDLPRRNIRALAGYLGHSPELVRRSAGHVEATAFIWRALVPLLEQAGVASWSALRNWLAEAPPSTRRKRVYPLAPERRRALPDRPGVYRFVRRNGDVLYVGKAASLKKRVASHFTAGGRATERALELLTQVHDLRVTETASILEAALLEADEIKRIDPPYNVQLRSGERSAWFASRDLREAVPRPDDAHRIGPLPSERSLSALAALIALAGGVEPAPRLRAAALAVPVAYLPDEALFGEGWSTFVEEVLLGQGAHAARRVQQAARALWLQRGRSEPEAPEEAPPALWDLARVRRRLERNLVQGGLLVRRSRWLCVLADADVAFQERGMDRARALRVAGAELAERGDLEHVRALLELPIRRPRGLRERQASFDAAAYDRLRVLATELRRIQDDRGEVLVRCGAHIWAGERLGMLMRLV